MTKIVGFGCSWMYGSELIDPSLEDKLPLDPIASAHYINTPYREQNSFLGLLNTDATNLSEPGNTLPGMLYRFMEHQSLHQGEDILYVFALTDSGRQSWYDNNDHEFKHSPWAADTKFHQDFKNHLVNSDCDELRKITHRMVATSIVNTCKVNEFKYVMMNALPNPVSIQDSNFLMPGSSMKELLDRNQEQEKFGGSFFHEGGHPNERGHQYIASELKNFIDGLYPNLL